MEKPLEQFDPVAAFNIDEIIVEDFMEVSFQYEGSVVLIFYSPYLFKLIIITRLFL